MMKPRWSIPQRPVKTAVEVETPVVENKNPQGGKPPNGKITKPAKAKTTRVKKQEK